IPRGSSPATDAPSVCRPPANRASPQPELPDSIAAWIFPARLLSLLVSTQTVGADPGLAPRNHLARNAPAKSPREWRRLKRRRRTRSGLDVGALAPHSTAARGQFSRSRRSNQVPRPAPWRSGNDARALFPGSVGKWTPVRPELRDSAWLAVPEHCGPPGRGCRTWWRPERALFLLAFHKRSSPARRCPLRARSFADP